MDATDLRSVFDRFDRDHNGAIDFGEFNELLNVLDPDMDDDERRLGFELIDTDHGGTIQFEEFAAWWDDDDE
ncbi:MAG: EF-hand domain-containing protein [Planctomycetaceae bacterium]|nr:EF-hand domain-containing protein [Planctomycetaceae bacterium]MCA9064125.1 EF-hand domain-containing protein [Planctomycetaceae bacterium]